MKKIILVLAVLIAAFQVYERQSQDAGAPHEPTVAPPVATDASNAALLDAVRAHRSSVLVQASGAIVRVLPDDRDGSRHQRILVEIAPAHTVLIAHNIDLAPRLADPQPGERLEFKGEYEWNERGGVVHWTHRDPQGRHEAGWLRYRGRTYQ